MELVARFDTHSISKTEFTSAICHLYYLLVKADGQVDEKEIRLGKIMAESEGINQVLFDRSFDDLQNMSRELVLTNCIKHMRRLSEEKQIRALAWICVLANSDGFMDKSEWALIYSIYNKELNLQLNKILEAQKEINTLIFGKTFSTFGIKVNRDQ